MIKENTIDLQNHCMRKHMGTETDLVNVNKRAPAFQPHDQRPERLLCHIFWKQLNWKEAIVSPLLLLQTT